MLSIYHYSGVEPVVERIPTELVPAHPPPSRLGPLGGGLLHLVPQQLGVEFPTGKILPLSTGVLVNIETVLRVVLILDGNSEIGAHYRERNSFGLPLGNSD